MTEKKTWRELEAEGVKRCCAMFTNGKRCRRRAVEPFEFSWCGVHGPIIRMHEDYAKAAIKMQAKADEQENDDD